jgi:hypothetical protein
MATASNSRARQIPGSEVAIAGDREPAILLSNAFGPLPDPPTSGEGNRCNGRMAELESIS